MCRARLHISPTAAGPVYNMYSNNRNGNSFTPTLDPREISSVKVSPFYVHPLPVCPQRHSTTGRPIRQALPTGRPFYHSIPPVYTFNTLTLSHPTSVLQLPLAGQPVPP